MIILHTVDGCFRSHGVLPGPKRQHTSCERDCRKAFRNVARSYADVLVELGRGGTKSSRHLVPAICLDTGFFNHAGSGDDFSDLGELDGGGGDSDGNIDDNIDDDLEAEIAAELGESS